SGKEGDLITIKGSGFLGMEMVTFNGVDITEMEGDIEATTLKVYVPVGATTGKVKIITFDNEGISPGNFTVIP
ncbi:MAG: hypothetical protein ACYCVX_16300, partial [Thiobacillus sp.]